MEKGKDKVGKYTAQGGKFDMNKELKRGFPTLNLKKGRPSRSPTTTTIFFFYVAGRNTPR